MWVKYYLGYGNLLVGISSISVAFLVISKNWRDPVKRAFFIFAMAVGLYALFSWPMLLSRDAKGWLFWFNLMEVPVVFIAIANVHFVFEWLGIAKRHRVFLISIYAFGIITAPLTFTPLFKDGLTQFSWGYSFLTTGMFYYIWIASYIILWNVAFFTLVKHYPALAEVKKKQAVLFFIGNIIGAISGLPNFLSYGGLAPQIPPLTNPFILFFVILNAYAIIRYRAMEIDTVIHKTVLWTLSILFLVAPIGITYAVLKEAIFVLSPVVVGVIVSLTLLIFLWYYHLLKPRIDHFFRRRKYDYQAVLGKVAEKISTAINIEELTKRLLNEVCDAMYLRNAVFYIMDTRRNECFLSGRRGYKEINSQRQLAAMEVFTDQDSKASGAGYMQINKELTFWIMEQGDIVEKDRLEADPLRESIKNEALAWLVKQEVEVLVPLALDNNVNAVLGLGKKENLQAYNSRDIQLLKKLGQEAGVTVFNALHYEELADKERLDEEMRMGRQIQMMLLPQEFPHVMGLTVQGMMEPAKEIGGDYYDFISLPNKDSLSIVIGDVSGKGVAAGLLMAMAKTAIHTLSQQETSPMKILLRTNQILNQHVAGQKFMTMLYFMWRGHTKTLTYSSAGHEHILIYRHNRQELEAIVSGGLMLGMIPDIENFLEEKELVLDLGDKILLYTDGVTEALNHAQERYGLDRLKDFFVRNNNEPAEELMRLIRDDVYVFIGETPQYDDITLVVLEAS